MKKTLLTILLGAFGAMVVATPVLAATSVSFTPVSVSVRQGQTFTLTIGVNPQGVKNYTAKTEVNYPADLLEIKSFTFANSWMPLSQPGYDLTDNASGVLIKTAGYPGGLSSTATFGTVSFLAKKSGNGTIALSGDSFVLNAVNQNVLASASVQTAVAIAVPVPVQTTPVADTPVIETTEEDVVSGEKASVISEPTTTPQPLLAAVGNFVTLGTDNIGIGIVVTIAILVLVGYALYFGVQRRARRKDLGKLK